MSSPYKTLENAILSGDKDGGVAESLKLIEGGQEPLLLFTECIEPLLEDIGEKFSRLEIFLP